MSFSDLNYYKKIMFILDAMTIKKIDLDFNDEDVAKVYDQYMINRWISMSEALIPVAEELTRIHNLTDEQHFQMLKAVLPQRKFYFKYIKADKELNAKEKRYIAHYFEIGLKDAEEYIRQMSQEEIDAVLKKYKYGKNDMIKV